jgi:hypothetical protein
MISTRLFRECAIYALAVAFPVAIALLNPLSVNAKDLPSLTLPGKTTNAVVQAYKASGLGNRETGAPFVLRDYVVEIVTTDKGCEVQFIPLFSGSAFSKTFDESSDAGGYCGFATSEVRLIPGVVAGQIIAVLDYAEINGSEASQHWIPAAAYSLNLVTSPGSAIISVRPFIATVPQTSPGMQCLAGNRSLQSNYILRFANDSFTITPIATL